MKGIVKFYDQKKGYGFISVKNSSDVFFHHSEFKGKSEPNQGDEVTFETKDGKKGIMAINVERT